MSHPWLHKNPNQSVRSRSRSPSHDKPRTKVDQFGRSLPQKSESKSRSSSRSRSRSNSSRHSRESGRSKRSRDDRSNFNKGHRDSRRGRTGRNSVNKRDRSSSSSSGSSGSSSRSSSDNTRIVASSKPKYLNARIFVANINSKEITKEDLVKHFEKYGDVIDVLVHTKNYAFIQYSKPEHAQLAVEGEHGSSLRGWRLDVKMAKENRKSNVSSGGPSSSRTGDQRVRGTSSSRTGDRRVKGRHDSGHFNRFETGRPPFPDGPVGRPPFPDGPVGRPRYPDGPMHPPFMDPFFDGRPRPPPGPFPIPGDFGLRDPYFSDPYNRGFPDPWLADDPFRRSMYPDPYRDVYGVRPPPPPPVIECEIFVVNSQLQAYGEAVERRVKEHSIITAVSVMPEGRTATQLVEELTAHSGLFAIFINPQNEMHRSLTLNILHGTPQEHRNMPLDDAIALVGKSFLKYVEGLREKAHAAAAPLPPPSAPSVSRVFLPATPEVSYLLNLLADNRALTVEELDTIIKYLQERRNKLIDAESRPLVTEEIFQKSPPLQQKDDTQSPRQETTASTKKDATSLSQDLTSRILSLFGASSKIKGVPPAGEMQEQPSLPTGAPPPAPPAQVPAPSSASLINFNNPNVQKALDNLLQNTPNLLKNINKNASLSAAQVGAPSVSPSMRAMSNSSYGREGEMAAGSSQGQSLNSQNLGSLHDSYEFAGQMMSRGRQGSTGQLPQGSQGVPGQGQMRGGYGLPQY